MKKVRKGKKMLITTLIAIIAIVLIIVLIVVNVNKKKNNNTTNNGDEQQVIMLPDTTYSDMEVSNVYMEYLKDEDKTMVSLSINNTTDQKVEDERLEAILIGADENVLGSMETWIQSLDVGEQYHISVILNGDLTATQLIKLEKK